MQVNNNLQAAANFERRRISRLPKSGKLHRRVRRLSDRHRAGRGPGAANRDVGGEGRRYGNAERRTHFWHQLVNAPGEARSDLWQLMEFSKRFKIEEVWPAELIAKKPESAARRCSKFCSRTARSTSFRCPTWLPATRTTSRRRSASTCRKGLFEEYAEFGRGHGHDLAPFDRYHEVRGLRWPVVNGKETRWRYREGHDPYVKPGKGVEFYGFADGKARIFALPYEPPPESPDTTYHTGS